MNKKGNNITWNSLQVSKLAGYWIQGLTATEISKLIGKSRSAILGKIRRLALKRKAHY